MDVLDDLLIRIMGDARSYETAVNKAIGDTNKLSAEINKNSGQIQGLTNQLGQLGGQAQGIIGMLASGLGIGSFIGTIQTAIDKAANMEQIEIAFTSLIGNVNLAKSTLEDLKNFAVATPFELPQILEAAKSMMAYGQQAETIVPTMQRLGDVAAALNIPLSSLTYLYGTLKSSGRVMTVDMRQFANRGIPIWLELAKVIGMVTKDTRELTGAQSAQLQQMVSKGKITFDMIEKAFIGMTSEGGRFFKMMENQSFSFTGLISNLKDSLGLLLADVGKQIIEGFDLKRVVLEIRNMAQAAADWFKNLDPKAKKFMFIIAGVVAAVGTLTAGFLALKGIVMVVGALLSTVGAPFLAIAGLIALAIAMWVEHVGGINKALDIGKTKLIEFWEFIKPIRDGLQELAVIVKDVFVTAFGVATEVAKDSMGDVTKDGADGWKRLRDVANDALLRIQFDILTLEKTYFGMWDEVERRGGQTLKILLFLTNQLVNSTEMMARGLLGSVELAGKLFDTFIPGGKMLSDFLGFSGGTPKTPMSEELKKLPKTFEEFKKMREEARKNGIKPDDVVPKKEELKPKAQETGKEVGKAMAKGIKEGLGDAILFGSAEHMRMLDAYTARLGKISDMAGPVGVAAAAGTTPPADRAGPVFEQIQQFAPVNNFAGGGVEPDSDLGHKLDEIRDILKEQKGRPVIEIEGTRAEVD